MCGLEYSDHYSVEEKMKVVYFVYRSHVAIESCDHPIELDIYYSNQGTKRNTLSDLRPSHLGLEVYRCNPATVLNM